MASVPLVVGMSSGIIIVFYNDRYTVQGTNKFTRHLIERIEPTGFGQGVWVHHE